MAAPLILLKKQVKGIDMLFYLGYIYKS